MRQLTEIELMNLKSRLQVGTLKNNYKEIIKSIYPEENYDECDLSQYLGEKQYFIFDELIDEHTNNYFLLNDDNWVIPGNCIDFDY